MTFLNSALLAGLAAVALPILIHLFSRRRYPLINFSTLRFLKKLQRQQMRKLKLRQWLLLLLRTAAVLLVVLAFARPALQKQLGLEVLSGSRTSMAIVLDGSASMQAKTRVGTVFEQGKTGIKTLISLMQPGDRTSVILARQGDLPFASAVSEDGESLLRTTEGLEAWDGGGDIFTAVNAAFATLDKSQDFRTELYIISDFTSPVRLPDPSEKVIPHFVHVPAESPYNLAVTESRIVSEIIEPGQPVDIEITFSNFGPTDREDIYYSIFLNGTRVGENVISLAAGAELKQRHQVKPEDPGLQEGMVQIEERDALTVDSRSFFCFHVPENLRLLLVGEETASRELKLSLSATSRHRSLINLTQAERNAWDTHSITDYDAIIFNDPPAFSPSQIPRLINFVNNGGGLLLLPGNQTDVGAINRNLLEKLGSPKWGERIGKPGDMQFFLGWREFALAAPLVRGIFKPESKPSTPRFYQALRLTGEPLASDIKFSDGTPFIAQTRSGNGRVLLCASSPQPEWSDWAERGIFAPLMYRFVLWLAGGSQEGCHALHAGDRLELSTFGGSSSGATLTFPDGQSEQRIPQVAGQNVVFVEPTLEQAGFYRLQAGQKTQIVAVNVPGGESDLRALNPADAFPKWEEAGVTVCSVEKLAETVRQSRYGRELWKAALIFCLGVLLLESVIGAGGKATSIALADKEIDKKV
jgi:hypothetical protein